MLTFFHPAVSALAFFQSTQLNLFERFLTQAVSGIDSTSITSGMQKIAYVVLLVGFLWQVYQSALHGGDVRGLGTNLIKYLVTAIVVMNYHAIFTTLNQGFVNSGNWINSASGTTNLLENWGNDLKTQFNQVGFQKLWDLISAGVAGFLDAILIIVAYILYPVVIVIFGFFYILYGSILYIFGPIVIALMPLGATNRLAKSYVENVFIWNAWPVLYGGFGALLSAVQMGQIGQMLNQNDFLGGLGNVEGSILIGLASIIYSLAIAVIPFIAKKIVSGDVGSTAGTLLGAAATALTAGIAAGEGVAAGVTASALPSGAQTANGSSATGTASTGSAPGIQGNQPAAAQRDSAGVPPGSPEKSGPSSPIVDSSPAEMVANSMRGNFENAMTPSGSRKDQEDTGKTIATSETASTTQSPDVRKGSSSVARSSGVSSGGGKSPSSHGPTNALMRAHGLATWGSYQAARLATKGAVGGARAAAGVAQEVAQGIANPVETASRVGAAAGRIAGTAVNASEKTATAAAKVANVVSNPGETVGAGVQAVTNAARGVATDTASTIRQSKKAVSTSFSDAYEKTRSGEASNDKGST
jgi:hypothetical protein